MAVNRVKQHISDQVFTPNGFTSLLLPSAQPCEEGRQGKSAQGSRAYDGSNDRTKVVFTASHGGHLGQAMRLRQDLRPDAVIVATKEGESSYPRDRIATVPTLNNLPNWIRNLVRSAILAHRLRPDIVVALGCRDVAFFCAWSKLVGARLFLVESFARVRTPSRFLRILAPLADRIFVQWPELLVRPIYALRPPVAHPIRQVLVVVGTFRNGMDRLLRIVDEACPLPGSPAVTCQIGNSKYIPKTANWYRWKPARDFQDDISHADLIVTHDGSNTIATALEATKPVVVVPRTPLELDYQSNAELATELSNRSWVALATDAGQLREAVNRIHSLSPTSDFSGPTIVSCIRSEIARGKTGGASSIGHALLNRDSG